MLQYFLFDLLVHLYHLLWCEWLMWTSANLICCWRDSIAMRLTTFDKIENKCGVALIVLDCHDQIISRCH